jgi:hypothetical protein
MCKGGIEEHASSRKVDDQVISNGESRHMTLTFCREPD